MNTKPVRRLWRGPSPDAILRALCRHGILAASSLFAYSTFMALAQARKPQSIGGIGQQPIRLTLVCDSPDRPVADRELASIKQIMQARLAKLGLQSARVEMNAANRGRFVVTLPAGADVERVKDLLTFPGKLELRPVAQGTLVPYRHRQSADSAAHSQPNYRDYEVVQLKESPARDDASTGKSNVGAWVVLEKKALIGSGDILKSSAGPAQYGAQQYHITISFSREGAERLGQWSTGHIGDYLAIVFDGAVRSAPVIKSRLFDIAVIEGDFDQKSAEDLAFALESGALPVPIRVLSQEGIR